MIRLVLIVLGLCLGSFVNALVWRLHEQANEGERAKVHNSKGLRRLSFARVFHADRQSRYSILMGRSMCPECHHELGAKDLVPLFSWLYLRGKCRYCGKPISWQYPLVELLTAVLFVASYAWWPYILHGLGLYYFIFWLVFLVGFMALAVYDLRWLLLPNKLVFPLIVLALLEIIGAFVFYGTDWQVLVGAIWGVLIASGIFYVIFQLSAGRWIGGGDVKLGVVIGLLLGGPLMSLLMLFVASCLGTIAGLPLLAAGKRNARLPFGPFLITATVIVMLFGTAIIGWYRDQFLR